jgi:hypothetical protein
VLFRRQIAVMIETAPIKPIIIEVSSPLPQVIG